ncbi:hypothetical protein CJ184_000065 [Actinotignum urinale]|uniref:hypothetical protein n=1 Tax=Actinotignum urinale TaxID=190146 RepID=UPI000C7F7BC8|nr:hypothetical protein [Actinotignum urinale]WIK59106.1 hypothetical protein CJ184_000065 [Actinotignum urinale]
MEDKHADDIWKRCERDLSEGETSSLGSLNWTPDTTTPLGGPRDWIPAEEPEFDTDEFFEEEARAEFSTPLPSGNRWALPAWIGCIVGAIIALLSGSGLLFSSTTITACGGILAVFGAVVAVFCSAPKHSDTDSWDDGARV